MTQIDWSKAPEGTTGAMVANFEAGSGYGAIEFIPHHGPRSIFYENDISGWTYHPAPWKDNGLPSVGTFVHVYDNGDLIYGQGESGPVLAHVEDTAVIRMSYGLGCFSAECLRTAEQMEEREAGIKEIDRIATSVLHIDGPRPSATALWDAGYRKQVTE